MFCYVMYAMLCNAMLCYVMLCYAMLCYVMLCYVMLCYVMYGPDPARSGRPPWPSAWRWDAILIGAVCTASADRGWAPCSSASMHGHSHPQRGFA